MKREQSAGYLANHMARLFKAMANEALASLGLSTAPFGVLLELWSNDGLTQGDLVGRLDIEQATAANTLTRMERDGLIVRRPDAADARRQIIHLTARSRKLEHPAKTAARGVNAKALSGLSPRERDVLLALMRRVIDAQRSPAGD